jgi:DNA repair protein RadD
MTTFEPRYYQQDAHDAAITHAKKSLESQVLVLPTGSGKSPLISMIAKTIHDMTGKRILCTAPTADLVKQNHAKYKSCGFKSSVFCASAGRKELRHDVIFGSPLSLLNSIDRINKSGEFSAIIIDESDLISTTVKNLIAKLKEANPMLRVIGLTATPYRLGMGFIFESHYKHGFIDEAYKPYFKKCTYEISPHELIEKGYLTQPIIGKKNLHYNTEGLILKSTGKWDQSTVDAAFTGKGRLTSDIVHDIVDATQGFNGVLIFASTIKHAEEVLESLPPRMSGIVHSKSDDRIKTMSAMESQQIKYIVNVDCLTVGIDWPHIDCIAVLRKTESARLYQQIIGRGTRLYPGKDFFLVLDYAENISYHFPDGDVFNPEIRARAPGETEKIPATCPQCNHTNMFAERPNDAGYGINHNGYFIWPDTGDVVLDQEGRQYPAHMGRRCSGIVGRTTRCSYYWSFRVCDSPCCSFMNDLAARFCLFCKFELVDPNLVLLLEQQEKEKQKAEITKTEPILNIEIQESFKEDKRIKVVIFKTIFNKQIRVFLRVSKEEERIKYRYYRDNKNNLEDKSIKFFKPIDKQFYKFIELV